MKRMMNLVEEISKLLVSTDEVDGLLDRAVGLIAEYMDVEVCSIYLFDPGSGKLLLKANRGLLKSDGVVSLYPGEGLVGTAFQQNRMLYEEDANKSVHFKSIPELDEERFPNFFAIPIFFKKRRLGVLVLQSAEKKKINEMQAKLLKSLSSQLAILLKNVELQGRMQNIAKSPPKKKEPVRHKRFSGKGVSPGITVGQAFFMHDLSRLEEIPISRISEEEVEEEKELFTSSLENAIQEMESWSAQMSSSIEEIRDILEGQILLLRDSVFQGKVIKYIESLHPMDSSLKMVYEEYKLIFENMQDGYFRERILDLKDVITRVLSFSSHHEHKIYDESILVVSEMLPSYFIQLDLSKIKGIVSKKVTMTSHSVILAKAFKIPMVTGIRNVFDYVLEGDRLILDAKKDEIIVNPDKHVELEYQKLLKDLETFSPMQVSGKSITKDGYHVKLSANLGLMHEIPMVLSTEFHDIGLYRTEFLFLLRKEFPNLEEQYDIYDRIMEKLGGKPVTFRTLDLGGDKQLSYFPLPEEENPLLGFRSIRIFKKHTQILKTQLKALMKTAYKWPCRVMFPLINNYEDFAFCISVIREAEKELKRDKHNYRIPELGIMVETPASIFNISRIAPQISFVSVGTNDLLQYLLAVDRNNVYTDDAYNVYDPGFIQALYTIGEQCRKSGIELNICGEAAGNPLLTPILISCGFHKLSMVPASIPQIHHYVQKLDKEEMGVLLSKVLSKRKALDVEAVLKRFYRKIEGKKVD